MIRIVSTWSVCFALVIGTAGIAHGADANETLAADKLALAPLQDYVGTWKGVGQPKRGSTQGAWSEQANWAWQFQGGHAAIAFSSPQGKYFTAGRLTTTAEPGVMRLTCTLPDGKTEEHYQGKLDANGALALVAEAPAMGRPARVTLRQVAEGKRLLVLLEQQLGTTDQYFRLAEVGYTREGSGFGRGATFPECVVTGGYADREVEYKGMRYKVCCEGCRELFLMDPEGILAEYRDRKKKEREEAMKK